jgi:hypothetical protein
MRRMTYAIFGAAFALGLAVHGHAQQGEQKQHNSSDPSKATEDPQEPRTITGEIVSKDPANDTLIIRTGSGARVTLSTNHMTQFRSESGETTDLGNLHLGDRVMIQTEPAPRGSTNQIASSIQRQTRMGQRQDSISHSPPSPLPDTPEKSQ